MISLSVFACWTTSPVAWPANAIFLFFCSILGFWASQKSRNALFGEVPKRRRQLGGTKKLGFSKKLFFGEVPKRRRQLGGTKKLVIRLWGPINRQFYGKMGLKTGLGVRGWGLDPSLLSPKGGAMYYYIAVPLPLKMNEHT